MKSAKALVLPAADAIVVAVGVGLLAGWDWLRALVFPIALLTLFSWLVVVSWLEARRSGSKSLLWRRSFASTMLVRASVNDTHALLTDVAGPLGAVESTRDAARFSVVIKTPVSRKTWGEGVTVGGTDQASGTEVVVTSRPALRWNIFDGGRNYKNVAAIKQGLGSRFSIDAK